jgi:hypothetical protein
MVLRSFKAGESDEGKDGKDDSLQRTTRVPERSSVDATYDDREEEGKRVVRRLRRFVRTRETQKKKVGRGTKGQTVTPTSAGRGSQPLRRMEQDGRTLVVGGWRFARKIE